MVNAMNPTRRPWRVFETACFRDMQSPFLSFVEEDFNGGEEIAPFALLRD
jgi:hypothetical protein